MQKVFIISGIILLLLGLAWPFIQRLGLSHLPGDIFIKREQFTFYFPLMTCLVISLVLSLILWLITK